MLNKNTRDCLLTSLLVIVVLLVSISLILNPVYFICMLSGTAIIIVIHAVYGTIYEFISGNKYWNDW